MVHEHIKDLSSAQETDREAILNLRKHPNLVRTEELRKKSIEIHYELEIPRLDEWNLAEVIANVHKNSPDDKIADFRLNIL
jgi:hypothetical protein